MRKEIYICDLCKKEVKPEELKALGIKLERYELCFDCFVKADKLLERYETEYKKITDKFDNEFKLLWKGEEDKC